MLSTETASTTGCDTVKAAKPRKLQKTKKEKHAVHLMPFGKLSPPVPDTDE